MNTNKNLATVSGIAHIAYGVHVDPKKDPFAFDDYDLWFGNDFDWIINELFEDVFDDLEAIISSDWSTNLSEARSAEQSLEESAKREAQLARGETPSFLTSIESSVSVMSSVNTVASSASTDSAHMTSDVGGSMTGTHDSKDFQQLTPVDKHNAHHYGPQPAQEDGDFTSDFTDLTIQTPSIKIVETLDKFEDATNSQVVNILTVEPTADNKFGTLGGLDWTGDLDNEYIFGTSWLDVLKGGDGNDVLYGLEGADKIYGGKGQDRIFGDGGDDMIYTSGKNAGDEDNTITEYDFASGGSGDDKIYGDPKTDGTFIENLFGGSGDDIIKAYGGDDHIEGGAGNDTIEGGEGMDNILGDEGIDKIMGGADNDDVAAGDGDDFVHGGAGDDDLQGGKGDDYIFGGSGFDKIQGGDGNDILAGQEAGDTTVTTVVIYGEDGDDEIFASLHTNEGLFDMSHKYDSTATNLLKQSWVSAGAGADIVWGANTGFATGKQQIWGGSGDDKIYGGSTVNEQFLYGQSGDDEIFQGSSSTQEIYVEGGKDDDIINQQYKWDSTALNNVGDYGYFKKDKAKTWVPHVITDTDLSFAKANKQEHLYGNSGDDTLWLGSSPTGGTQLAHGGTGNDKVYGGYGNSSSLGVTLIGGAGKDLIRSDWWQEFGEPGGTPQISKGMMNEYLYGDYKYGDGTGANFDDALDDQLWGDDDIIHGQDGAGATMFSQNIFGGDGDDQIYSGDAWGGHHIRGNRGDDLIVTGTIGNNGQIVYGGSGNDTIIPSITDFTLASASTGAQSLSGNDGDDFIRGAHKTSMTNTLSGDAGDDVIYGGNTSATQIISGGYGNDDIHGGNTSSVIQTLTGGSGDDRIWGGQGNLAVDLDGNEGNDQIWEGDLNTGTRVINGGSGDDVIDVGDGAGALSAFGGSGNDKVIGGLATATHKLYGNTGDDKIWSINPGQSQAAVGPTIYGESGNDVIYGSNGYEYLLGDSKTGADGGDDIIFTGENDAASTKGDLVKGGGGNDRIYGQGSAFGHLLSGGNGDDWIWGGSESDTIYGDHLTTGGDVTLFGNDHLYGGQGNDLIHGQTGHDIIKGGEGIDHIFGGDNDDTMWGETGADVINTGYGLDTVFGGDDCDDVQTYGGGDVIWLGSCTAADKVQNSGTGQTLKVYGTGLDQENYTVLMDFWLEDTVSQNELCMEPDKHNDGTGSYPICETAVTKVCYTAASIMGPAGTNQRGDGCKDDGGPLWIRVPIALADENVWGQVFQRTSAAKASSHTGHRYTQLAASEASYPATPHASSLAECFAAWICEGGVTLVP